MRRALIAGNWKMNLDASEARDLASAIRQDVLSGPPAADVLVCPPHPFLPIVGEAIAGSGVDLGGQDCHAAASGAHTGDTAAGMLASVGCSACIVGHSERRADHQEKSELVAAKAAAALGAGLTAVVCIGETEKERRAGKTLSVVSKQLAHSIPKAASVDTLVIAYEPVWAIGSGLAATPDDIAEVHAAIRDDLPHGLDGSKVRILYGGSVKPDNAEEILALEDVDGALVGGASLKFDSFRAIYRAVA